MTIRQVRGKWIVDFYSASGERLRRVSPTQTKRGAERYERELVASASSISPSSSDAAKTMTLAEFAPEWLKTYALVHNSPSEVIAKEVILRRHLIRFFDNCTLDQITTRDIERYKAAKLKPENGDKPLTAKSVNNHLTVLRKLLVTAEEWKLICSVPRIRRLRLPTATFDWLNAEEGARFLAAVEEHYPQWKALFWTALRTGMRRGELFALRWEDIDFVARTIRVRHSVFRGKLVPPKNKRERTIPMTASLLAVLKEHRARTMMRSEFVFPKEDGTLTTHQDQVNRPLEGALKRAGLRRVTFHALRHSFASQLVSAGRSLKEVQELLGHTSIQVTMRYAHLAPERMRDAVEVLDHVPAPRVADTV